MINLASLIFPSTFAAGNDIAERESAWWSLGGMMSRKTQSGETVSPESAMQLAPYYACLRNLSEDVAKLPMVLYRRTGKSNEPATNHPLYRILHDQPCPESTSMTFRETLTHWAAAWGNGYAEIVRNGAGDVAALYPIHPSRVRVRRTDGGAVVYDVQADVSQAGKTYAGVTLKADDVLHIHGLGGGLMGYSVLRLASESLGLGLATQTFGAAFFGNGASMNGMLVHPGKLSDTARTNLRTTWQEMHGGAKNAFKTAILEEGVKYERFGIPPEEAQFLETRGFTVVDTCRWFRMPPHKIQDLSRSTFSNIEQQNQEYVTDALMPWASRWEQECKRKLFPDEDDLFVKLEFRALLRGDHNARANFYRTLINVGVMSPNEVRELEDLNPGEEALDEFYMQSNMLPLDRIGEVTARDQAPPQKDNAERDAADRGDQLGAQVASMRPIFVDAADRVLRKEVMAAGKATERYKGKPDTFASWADAFYAEQAEYMVTAFGAAVGALVDVRASVLGTQRAIVDLQGFAERHCKESRAAAVASQGLALRAENTPEALATAVMDLVLHGNGDAAPAKAEQPPMVLNLTVNNQMPKQEATTRRIEFSRDSKNLIVGAITKEG